MCQMLFLRAVSHGDVVPSPPPSFQFWGCASALRAGGALVMANPTSCWEVCGCRDGWTDRQLHKASPVPWGGDGGHGTIQPICLQRVLGSAFCQQMIKCW